MEILSALSDALTNLFQLQHLSLIFFGVCLGLLFGVLPGLSSVTGLAILLPFTFGMETTPALALMIGLMAATNTSDTLPAVIFGIPGTTTSQATILDGHPLARQGQAARALGAAYTASLMGGIFGAIALTASLHILSPFILAFGSPELFMLGLLGISMTGSLSGNQPVKGIAAGCLGLLIGAVGLDILTGHERWTFGSLYLFDGVSLVIVALGMFGIPEIVDLAISGTHISQNVRGAQGSVLEGIRDTFRHWFLVLRTAMLGTIVGALPGLSGPVVDWFAYSHAMATEKGARQTFGKGDIRGVIGVDAASNAKQGGGLIPTLAFGIPGTTANALVLGILIMQGLPIGPQMLAHHADVTLTLAWGLVSASVFATGIMPCLVPATARIATLPIHLLVPILIVIISFAAYQSTSDFGDLITLLLFSILGWFMKQNGWPRPPLVLGVILSSMVERYLSLSMGRYGFSWMSRPIVLVVGLLIVASIFAGYYGRRRARMDPTGSGGTGHAS